MPYINQLARTLIDLCDVEPDTAGELNYAMTMLAKKYLEHKGKSYQTIAEILSAFDGASKEFYRRVAAPYEDTKIAENGDVY